MPSAGTVRQYAAALLLIGSAAACGHPANDSGGQNAEPTGVLTVGLAAPNKDVAFGTQQVARNIALEPLIVTAHDGRPSLRLAAGYSTDPDGLAFHVQLRRGVVFHDGRPADAAAIAQALSAALTTTGLLSDDIKSVHAASPADVQIDLKRPTRFIEEALDIPIEEPGAPGVGTGPFRITRREGSVELEANDKYYLGPPRIRAIDFVQYPTTRAAWADMLRNKVDMLYEVGVDAMDSLQPSSNVAVFPYLRHYAATIVLNGRHAALHDARVRRALNLAIDRQRLVRDGLKGHGKPAESTIWPFHWAYDSRAAHFDYDPTAAAAELAAAHATRLTFTCIVAQGYSELEHVAVAVQQQLRTLGIQMTIEAVPANEVVTRVSGTGDFDAALLDAALGPNLVRPYLWWHSSASLNVTKFSSRAVDDALDAIRDATDDTAYKAGVRRLQDAIVADPPAVFLAWEERARAVSRRFDVQSAPDTDIWGSGVGQWKPVVGDHPTGRN